MSNFSFTSFLNNKGSNNSSNNYNRGTSAHVRKPSPNQVKFYYDLCERKRVNRKDINQYTFDQLGEEIQALQAMPDPASERQLEKIKELQNEIIANGGDMKPMSDAVLNSLTGGREGSASSLIQTLFDMRAELNINAPVTEAQLKILVEWFLCPDVPFEEFSSEEVYAKKYGANQAESQTVTISIQRRVDLGNGEWRLMLPSEFAEEISSKMTKKQASKFIDDYRGAFYDWRKTRITSQQIKYIRELETRLANVSKPSAHEWVMVDGEYQQVTKDHDLNADWNPTAYTPFDELQLAQMSAETASDWIDQLKSEVARKNAYQEGYDQHGDYNYAQAQVNDYQDTMEKNRQAKSLADAKVSEFNKLNDLIYAVESILGYNNDEIHDMVQEFIMEDIDSSKMHDYKMRIREFFASTVTANQDTEYAKWASQMARIAGMCEDVPVAMEILTYNE